MGSDLRFAPVGAKQRSTGPLAPHLPHYYFGSESLDLQDFRSFFIFKLIEHVHIRHFFINRRFVGRCPVFQRFCGKNVTLLCGGNYGKMREIKNSEMHNKLYTSEFKL